MSDERKATGPVLIELENTPEMTPAEALPVPEVGAPPKGAAMQTIVTLGARRRSSLGRWFWSLLVAIIGFGVSITAYDFVMSLLARSPVLGVVAMGLLGAFVIVLLIVALKEWVALARLRRVDGIQRKAQAALDSQALSEAQLVTTHVEKLYASRSELKWGMERLRERKAEVFDADSLLSLTEVELLIPLDQAAVKEVEAAARQVATVTAIVPMALADVAAALTSNIRMIRRIAEIYGGRAGSFGSWRLMRAVMTHLVATGAVAVGDDLLGSLAGGGVVSKLSRRFGEGVVNGALTARVGVAAIEVCRPMPFVSAKRPAVSGVVKRALTGLFGK